MPHEDIAQEKYRERQKKHPYPNPIAPKKEKRSGRFFADRDFFGRILALGNGNRQNPVFEIRLGL